MNEENLELFRLARNEYYRQYRKNNPQKIKQIQQRYYLRKAIESLKNETQAE